MSAVLEKVLARKTPLFGVRNGVKRETVFLPETFLVLDDLDSSEACWSGMLQDAPRMELGCCFSHDETRVMGFKEEGHRGETLFLPHCVKGIHHPHNLFVVALALTPG